VPNTPNSCVIARGFSFVGIFLGLYNEIASLALARAFGTE